MPPTILDRADLDAVIFDLDGVLTSTAAVHAAAWKELFDGWLRQRAEAQGEEFRPFDLDRDYRRYVDGKPRFEGVKSFLAARGIDLPFGDPGDPPEAETICGLGNRKNLAFRRRLEAEGAEPFADALDLLRRLRPASFRLAIVSASRNAPAVLAAAGLEGWFQAQVDGIAGERLGLAGKPAPDVFLEAARRLGVPPRRAAVIEDAVAGVRAGRAGGFGLVVGIDRRGHGEDLQREGADRVVNKLTELRVAPDAGSGTAGLPSALSGLDEIAGLLAGVIPAVFLDYDGTLTPIVPRPEDAVLRPEARRAVRELAGLCPVAVVSGRDRRDVQALVGIEGICYAGSHGFDIVLADGRETVYEPGRDYLPDLDAAEAELRERLGEIAGAQVERKRFAIAIHFRRVAAAELATVEETVAAVHRRHGRLRRTGGKKIFELRPDLDWDKGKAVGRLLGQLGLDRPTVLPIYLGDDETDEDAFRELRGRGLGIVVRDEDRPTAAAYALESAEEVARFLDRLAALLRGRPR